MGLRSGVGQLGTIGRTSATEAAERAQFEMQKMQSEVPREVDPAALKEVAALSVELGELEHLIVSLLEPRLTAVLRPAVPQAGQESPQTQAYLEQSPLTVALREIRERVTRQSWNLKGLMERLEV